MEIIFSEQKGSITNPAIRRLLLIAVFLPLLVGVLQWFLVKQIHFSSTNSIILFSFLTATIFVFFIGLIAKAMRTEEQRLIYSERLSRLLVENRKDYAIFMIDIEGNIINWNKGAERMMGYQSSEIIGKPITILFTQEDKENNALQDFLYNSAYQRQVEYEGWRVTKNGEKFWATITSTGIYDENQKLIGFTKLYRNSTRQKATDDKLKRLVESLEHSNQELERFAYIASHDLQEPLRMISSYTKLLEKKYHDKLDDEAREYIYFAVDGAMRMQQLITDLLLYSRVTTRGKPFLRTDTQALVEQVIHSLGVSIHETGAHVTYDKLPIVMADEVQLTQLFQNLIGNAIKFHDSKPPRVHLSAKQVGGEWVFSIEDQGIGIAEQFHEQIFLIFQRLHNRKNYPGTGVGLAICKRIVERRGGRIWVESQLGRGAKFCFTIPV